MREFAMPAHAIPGNDTTLIDPLRRHAVQRGRSPALWHRRYRRWECITFAQLHDLMTSIAKGIAAAGVQPGDRVGLMSASRPEWTIVDYGIWCAGAIPVPISAAAPQERVEWILSDSGAVALFLAGDAERAVFEAAADRLPNVRHVWQFADEGLDRLAETGEIVGDDDLDARCASLLPSSTATLVYPSGTGPAVALTHANLRFAAETTSLVLEEVCQEDPLVAHGIALDEIAGRLVQLACIQRGIPAAFPAPEIDSADALRGPSPTVLVALPSTWQRLLDDAGVRAHLAGTGRIFDNGATTAVAFSTSLDGSGPGLGLRARHAAFDRAVYSGLRDSWGGRLRWAVCVGELTQHAHHLLRGLGLTVLPGFGLPETSGVATLSSSRSLRTGSVGQPIPGTAIGVHADGRLQIRGPHVFAGYWNDERASAAARPDGTWFAPATRAAIDDDGFLRLTEAAPAQTSGSALVAEDIESRVQAHPLVARCWVAQGPARCAAALVVLDEARAQAWLRNRGEAARSASDSPADLGAHPDLLAEIRAEIDRATAAAAPGAVIDCFAIVPPERVAPSPGSAWGLLRERSDLVASVCDCAHPTRSSLTTEGTGFGLVSDDD